MEMYTATSSCLVKTRSQRRQSSTVLYLSSINRLFAACFLFNSLQRKVAKVLYLLPCDGLLAC